MPGAALNCLRYAATNRAESGKSVGAGTPTTGQLRAAARPAVVTNAES